MAHTSNGPADAESMQWNASESHSSTSMAPASRDDDDPEITSDKSESNIVSAFPFVFLTKPHTNWIILKQRVFVLHLLCLLIFSFVYLLHDALNF